MKYLPKIAIIFLLNIILFSCSNEKIDEDSSNLTANEITLIKEVGANHNRALDVIYDKLLRSKNEGTLLRTNLEPRLEINNSLTEFGETIYQEEKLSIYISSIAEGESILTQSENLNEYTNFSAIIEQSFIEIKDKFIVANMNSSACDNYLDEIKNIMLNSYNNSDLTNLTTILDLKFSEIETANTLNTAQKAILLSTIDLYKASLIYWESNINNWFELNNQDSNKIEGPNINYTVVGAADAIGAVRGAVIGAAAGLPVGGIGAIPGAICGALAGGAQGSALAAGAQLLAWAWNSYWD